jgi:hypothetical protein
MELFAPSAPPPEELTAKPSGRCPRLGRCPHRRSRRPEAPPSRRDRRRYPSLPDSRRIGCRRPGDRTTIGVTRTSRTGVYTRGPQPMSPRSSSVAARWRQPPEGCGSRDQRPIRWILLDPRSRRCPRGPARAGRSIGHGPSAEHPGPGGPDGGSAPFVVDGSSSQDSIPACSAFAVVRDLDGLPLLGPREVFHPHTLVGFGLHRGWPGGIVPDSPARRPSLSAPSSTTCRPVRAATPRGRRSTRSLRKERHVGMEDHGPAGPTLRQRFSP